MNELIINEGNIQNKIYAICGVQVMIDRDLAELYQVETRRINEQVKRNDGQIFDAYVFVNDLLKNAKKEIIFIDNYIDNIVLTFFSKYQELQFKIITKLISKQFKLDIDRYNSQYNYLQIKISNKFYDRFLILDNKEAYYIGASLKDLGKKKFGFSKIDFLIVDNAIRGKSLDV